MYKKIDKENIGQFFADLSKELKKEFGRNAKFDLVVVGGASILLNYSFRDTTTDIDAYYSSISSIKSAVQKVAEKNNLPDTWLNNDFTKTNSFSQKLVQYSQFYKTYNQSLTIRTVKDEYLIAMKIMAGREYKHDISDMIGILQERCLKDKPIEWKQIEKAIENLYGSKDKISPSKLEYYKTLCNIKDHQKYVEIYQNVQNQEKNNLNTLMDFEENYDNVLNEKNVNDVLNNMEKYSLDDILSSLDKIPSKNEQKLLNKEKEER